MMLKQYLVKRKFFLLKILINRFFTVFLEKQFPISFIKICKNYTNLEVLYDLYITYYITYKLNYITFKVQKTKIKGN